MEDKSENTLVIMLNRHHYLKGFECLDLPRSNNGCILVGDIKSAVEFKCNVEKVCLYVCTTPLDLLNDSDLWERANGELRDFGFTNLQNSTLVTPWVGNDYFEEEESLLKFLGQVLIGSREGEAFLAAARARFGETFLDEPVSLHC